MGDFTKILDKLQRAAKNGERLHLDVDQVRALVASPVYGMLNELHAEEMVAEWQTQPALKSASSGSNTAQSETGGALPGTIAPLVQDAESKLTLEAASLTIRQSKRNRRSQLITPPTIGRRKPQSPLTLVSHQSSHNG